MLEERVRRKREIYGAYRQLLGGLPDIAFMPEAPWARCTHGQGHLIGWLTCIIVASAQFGATREEIRLALEQEDIASRPLWKPMHLQLGGNKLTQFTISSFRQMGLQRREAHRRTLWQEAERLAAAARSVGVQRVIVFGSLARGEANALSDLDLLVVWDTPLGFLERTVELYRCLQPRAAVDLLVYTPLEMERMIHKPWIRRALEEGKVLYEA